MSRKFSVTSQISKPRVFLYGTIISLLCATVCILLFALLLTLCDLSASIAYPLSSLSIGFGGLVGSRYVSRKIGEKGYLCGIIIGIIIFSINSIVIFVMGGGSFTFFSLIRFVIVIIMSMLGGILGINTKSSKSLVK